MDLYQQAQKQYPRLPKNIAYRENLKSGSGDYLEFYPKGESDSFDPSRPAMEVFSPKVRPEDVAGDIVSHYMVNNDPTIAQAYRSFLMSVPLWQQRRMQEQYEYAKKNEGEERPFNQWMEMSGQPAYFRGAAFHQWPNPQDKYTPEQMSIFDRMNQYLRGKGIPNVSGAQVPNPNPAPPQVPIIGVRG